MKRPQKLALMIEHNLFSQVAQVHILANLKTLQISLSLEMMEKLYFVLSDRMVLQQTEFLKEI